MKFFDTTTGIGASFRKHAQTRNHRRLDGKIDVEVEKVFYDDAYYILTSKGSELYSQELHNTVDVFSFGRMLTFLKSTSNCEQ